MLSKSNIFQLFIAGLNRFEPRDEFNFDEYLGLLDEEMTFNNDKTKIKSKMTHYNEQIIPLLSSGGIMPFSVSRNFEFLPDEVLDSVAEAEWEIDSRYTLEEFRAFVNIMVKGNMKLWHLNVSSEFHKFLADNPIFLKGNYIVLSHDYIWKRLIMNMFTDLEGRNGSIKDLIDF